MLWLGLFFFFFFPSYCSAQSVLQQQLLNNSQQLGTEFPISPASSTGISADSLRSQLQHLLVSLTPHFPKFWVHFVYKWLCAHLGS